MFTLLCVLRNSLATNVLHQTVLLIKCNGKANVIGVDSGRSSHPATISMARMNELQRGRSWPTVAALNPNSAYVPSRSMLATGAALYDKGPLTLPASLGPGRGEARGYGVRLDESG